MRTKLYSVGAMVCAVLAGCSTFTPGDAGRGTHSAAPPSIEWPARDLEVLRAQSAKTPARVMGFEWRKDAEQSKATDRDRYVTSHADFTVHHNAVHGLALVRLFEDHRAVNHPAAWPKIRSAYESTLGFLPNGTVITSRGLSAERAKQVATQQSQWLDFGNISREREGEQTVYSKDLTGSRLLSGMHIRIPPREQEAPKGLVLHLHALRANPGERAMREEMIRRGWAVIDVHTDSQIEAPLAKRNREAFEKAMMDRNFAWTVAFKGFQVGGVDGRGEEIVVLARPLTMARDFKAAVAKMEKLSEYEFELTASTDAGELGAEIARLTDDALASNAYGVEAIVMYLREHRPDLLRGPLVIMGYSAGSLATPAVIARLRQMENPPRIDAVVLTGSGADLFMLSQESTLTDGGVTLRDGKKKPTKEMVAKVGEAYRARVNLDPMVAGAYLQDLPVLQVHASRDDWVPHEGGELLYGKLGRPDRLTVSGGHIRLFWTLSWYQDQIADWVESKVRAKQPAAMMPRDRAWLGRLGFLRNDGRMRSRRRRRGQGCRPSRRR